MPVYACCLCCCLHLMCLLSRSEVVAVAQGTSCSPQQRGPAECFEGVEAAGVVESNSTVLVAHV